MHYDRPRNFSSDRLFSSPRRSPGELYRKKENSSAKRQEKETMGRERSRVQPQVLPKGAWCSNEMVRGTREKSPDAPLTSSLMVMIASWKSSGNSRKETSRFVFRTRYGVATRTVVERRFEPSQGRGWGWIREINSWIRGRKREGRGKRRARRGVVVDSCAPVRLPTIKVS